MPSFRKKSDLRKYQVFMARVVIRLTAVLLAVDMGLGKTAAVLTAIRRLLDECRITKILIIAPKFVAQYTWPDEIAAWAHTRPLRYSVLVGTPQKRKEALSKDVEIHIINRENLPWLWRTLGSKKWDYDMIVYDESSRLKGGKKRTKGGKNTGRRLSEFGALANARARTERVVELTGTPAPNGLQDLWGQAYILDGGERLGHNRSVFEQRWFDSDYMGYSLTPKPHAHDEIMDEISDVMLSLRAEDHIELPPIVPNIIEVRLPSKILKEYKAFEKTLVSEAYDVEAVSKGVLTNKLLQFANGSLYRPIEGTYPPKKEVVHVHDLKLDALESIVAEAAGQPILCAYGFKFDRARILKRFPHAVCVDDDPDWKKKWDTGKVKLLVAHPASMSHGLNLQHGGHIAVWYGLTWSLETYQQFNTRLPRPGQKSPYVVIHHIVAKGTADETVLDVLQHKGATQEKITNAVRKRILLHS